MKSQWYSASLLPTQLLFTEKQKTVRISCLFVKSINVGVKWKSYANKHIFGRVSIIFLGTKINFVKVNSAPPIAIINLLADAVTAKISLRNRTISSDYRLDFF